MDTQCAFRPQDCTSSDSGRATVREEAHGTRLSHPHRGRGSASVFGSWIPFATDSAKGEVLLSPESEFIDGISIVQLDNGFYRKCLATIGFNQ